MVEKKRLLAFSLERESEWLNKKIKKVHRNFDEIIYVTFSEDQIKFPQINNLEKLNSEDFINEATYENHFRILNEFVLNISKEIFSDETIRNNFLIDGINLWWFLPIRIFSILVSNKTLMTLTKVSNILNQVKPEKVFFDSSSKNAPLIKIVCDKMSIKYDTNMTFISKVKNKIKEITVNLFAGLKRRIEAKKLARWSKTIINTSKILTKNKQRIAFTFLESDFRLDFNIKGELKKHDIYQKNIQLKLKELSNFEIYSINLIKNTKQIESLTGINEEIKSTNHIPLYHFYSQKLSNKSAKARRTIRIRLKKLFKNPKFKNAFTFNGFSLIDAYSFIFSRQFSTQLVTGFEYIHLFRDAFSLIKPKVFIHYNENSGFGRAAILASKMLNFPVIALQHGNISFSSASAYFIYKKWICNKNQNDLTATCCHMSSILSVYSKEDKDMLVNYGGFSEDRIKVTGCPRWDIILNKDVLQKDDFHKKIGLDSNKKTIVVLSQPLKFKEYRDIFRKEVLEAFKNNKHDLQIIWKPHPRENEDEIRELVRNYKTKNIIVQKNLPLFQVLNACDIALTTHSTAGLEAMLFDKPLITLIPRGEVEAKLFKGSDAVFKVINHEELTNAIDLLLNDEKTKKQIKKGRDKLIVDYLEFDGKASQRNAELILKMSE
ncbi:MAG: hypothetical protein GNW80_03955 [Asgard group archaeon]|nr:hypothetical protein [Asgard group archaeon]